jgi:hypothetical protein
MSMHINTINACRVALSTLSSPTPLSAVEIASAILQVIESDEQSEMIKRIDKNVGRLMKASMDAGKDHLKNALSTNDLEARKHWLQQALNSFINAKNIEAPPENIRAATYVAACFQALGDETLASTWYKNSYQIAEGRRQELLSAIALLKSNASLYRVLTYGLCWSIVIIFVYVFYWQDKTCKGLLSIYTELFDVERQCLQLQQILTARELPCPAPELFFPSAVAEVQEWSILLDGSNTGTPELISFDDQGLIVSCLHLLTGKQLERKDITGAFRRNGKHLVDQWRT